MKKISFYTFTIFFLIIVAPIGKSEIHPSILPDSQETFISEIPYVAYSTLDPATNYDSIGNSIIQVIYEGLFTYNGNSINQYLPSLALNYTISPDGLMYTYHLRQGVNFSDGSPFNAYIMQYSIQRAIIMNDPHSGVWVSQSFIKGADYIHSLADENISQANFFLSKLSVRAVSDYILEINTSTPSSAFISSLTFPCYYAVSPSFIITHEPTSYTTNQSDKEFGMVSLSNMFPNLTNSTIRSKLGLLSTQDISNSGIVPQSSSDGPAAYTYFFSHALGTGPYIFNGFSSGGTAVNLIKNANWWNNNNFNPKSPTIIKIQQIPDLSTRLLDVSNNYADSVYVSEHDLNLILNLSTLDPLQNNVNVITYPSLSEYFISFNENSIGDSTQLHQTNAQNGYNISYIEANKIVQYSWNSSNGSIQYASPNNPFTSLLFRKAFSYVFNYTVFLQDYSYGMDSRMEGIIPKGIFGHQDDLIKNGFVPTQNLTLAKSLFKEVNWQGYITISFYLDNPYKSIFANLLKDQIAKLNVGISILVQGYSDYNPQVEDSPILFFEWNPDFAHPQNFMDPMLLYNNRFYPQMNYSNPYLSSLSTQADNSRNITLINSIYRQIEKKFSQDFPIMYLDQETHVKVFNQRITGMTNISSGISNPILKGINFQFLGIKISSSSVTSTTSMTSTRSSSTTTISTSSIISSESPPINNNIFGSILNYFKIIVLSSFIIGPLLLTIVVLIEYRSYSKIKQNKTSHPTSSFINYLKTRLKRSNPKAKGPQHLSEETIDIIEDIIEENKTE